MTSLAFIFGVLPLAISTGAGANSRIAIGTAVIGGMLTATVLAIFYIPLFFVLVRRGFARRDAQASEAVGKQARPGRETATSPPPRPSCPHRPIVRCCRSQPDAPAVLLAALLASAGCSLAPRYVRTELPVPPSWPVGDAYLRQSEAALPASHTATSSAMPRLQQHDRSGAGQQPRPARRGREHRRGARAIPHPARRTVARRSMRAAVAATAIRAGGRTGRTRTAGRRRTGTGTPALGSLLGRRHRLRARPVRPGPLAHLRGAQPLFRDRKPPRARPG